MDAQRGVDGGYQLVPGAALPPLVLDDEEAGALAVGLLGAAHSPVAGTADASIRALGKVIQVMPRHLRRRVEALHTMTEPAAWAPPGPSVVPETLISVAQACRDTERLEFDYRAADQVHSERHVEPHRLVWLGRNWYLVAYDLTRHDWRSFRLDRLAALSTTGKRFAPRPLPAEDAADFVRSGIAQAPRSFTVHAVVQAPARDVGARIGRWGSVAALTDDTCRVQISAESLDWATLALAVAEADFVVEGPPELIEHLEGLALRFAGAVKSSPKFRIFEP